VNLKNNPTISSALKRASNNDDNIEIITASEGASDITCALVLEGDTQSNKNTISTISQIWTDDSTDKSTSLLDYDGSLA